MAYKILDLYRDLPGTNCGECGKNGCFAFAGAVFLEGRPLAACPHLPLEDAAAIASRISPSECETGANESEQVAALLDRLRAADWQALARRAGEASYSVATAGRGWRGGEGVHR